CEGGAGVSEREGALDLGSEASGGGGDNALGPIPRMLRTLFVPGRFRPITAITKPAVNAELLALAAAGRLTPEIERTFPLADARAALASVDAGHTVGKVVVVATA
ncbi:MAG: hypothetical protein EOO67_14495, partial [Microbacterium sp.]